jgi:hypothetical protein
MKRYHPREKIHTVTTWEGKQKTEFTGTLREISEQFKIPLKRLRNRIYHSEPKLTAQEAVFFAGREDIWQEWEDRIVLEEMARAWGYAKRVQARLPHRSLRAIRHEGLRLRKEKKKDSSCG